MNRRLAKWIAAFAVAGLGLASQACVIRETGVNRGYGYGHAQGGYNASGSVYVGDPNPYYVSSMPPEPLYENMSSSPGYGYVWIDGYWNWSGYEWVWVNGSWSRDQSGYVYVQPYYDYGSDNQYVYYPGHWSRPERVPERVKIVDHRDGRPRTGYQPPRTHTTPPGSRDHRDDSPPSRDTTPPPSRDHRDDSPPSRDTTPPPSRDHRDDKAPPSRDTTPPRDHRAPDKTPSRGDTNPPRGGADDKDRGDQSPPPRAKTPKKPPRATTPKKNPQSPPKGGATDHAPDRTTPRKPPKKTPSRDHRRSSMTMTTGHEVAMTTARTHKMKTGRE